MVGIFLFCLAQLNEIGLQIEWSLSTGTNLTSLLWVGMCVCVFRVCVCLLCFIQKMKSRQNNYRNHSSFWEWKRRERNDGGASNREAHPGHQLNKKQNKKTRQLASADWTLLVFPYLINKFVFHRFFFCFCFAVWFKLLVKLCIYCFTLAASHVTFYLYLSTIYIFLLCPHNISCPLSKQLAIKL